ncbi:MBL fold metallo-hydrolase [Nitriliruptoraceae bacterium ZYF776]|nr:MBL fold metallo-hydrolase [Profundirhabdus halotolerans]
MTQVAAGVHLVVGRAVNWVVLVEGRDAVLIDAGYPRDADDVEVSLAEAGVRLEQLVAVLVTHAHVDHIGGLPELLRRRPVPVLTSPREAAHARREFVEQVSPVTVAANLWRPRVLPWSATAVRRGGTRHVRVPEASDLEPGVPLDLPGRPVPIVVPGHTSGHTCFHLPDVGVVVSGDALVTGHPTSADDGPQLLPAFFHQDPAEARASLDRLASLAAEVTLPGHGPVHLGPIAQAVERARR